jgi:hypothetical protein
MCFAPSNVKGLSKWNWDGDVIVQQPVVPSGRQVVGVRARTSYPIDVREFLVSSHNAVLECILRHDIPSYLGQEGGNVARFLARTKGSFDYRAAVITRFVADTIEYQSGSGRDPWQFPDETWAIRAGDCEDRAFLIASLLLASGISSFNVRVALGQMVVGNEAHDHIWVVYKNERGHWMLIEPLRLGRAATDEHLPEPRFANRPAPVVEYVPRFLFNDCHLWAVRGQADSDCLQRFLGREWSRLNPKFTGEVHKSIMDDALRVVPGVPSWVKKGISHNFSRLFLVGPIIDAPDLHLLDYSPLDHFDNGYIEDSWGLVRRRLVEFHNDPRANLREFAYAAHAIADFYAHSSYVHFATLVDPASPLGHANIYDDANPAALSRAPSYGKGSTFDLTDTKFTVNSTLWTQGKEAAAERWKGKLISGRYAQPHDIQTGSLGGYVTEAITSIPDELQRAPGFADRGSLPHHNQIAVDQEAKAPEHRLYTDAERTSNLTDPMSHENQFLWRKNTAILHIRKAFVDNFR